MESDILCCIIVHCTYVWYNYSNTQKLVATTYLHINTSRVLWRVSYLCRLVAYFILYLAWLGFCSLMLISLSGHMVTWSDGSPLFCIFPFESALTLFARIGWQSVSYPASWPPPLNLVRLSVIIPFAGIGPRLIFHGVRRFEMGIHPPPRWCCRSLGERAILCRCLPPSSPRHFIQLSCPANSCQLEIMRPDLSDPQNCQTHWLLER